MLKLPELNRLASFHHYPSAFATNARVPSHKQWSDTPTSPQTFRTPSRNSPPVTLNYHSNPIIFRILITPQQWSRQRIATPMSMTTIGT